jgi:hypothetical protein
MYLYTTTAGVSQARKCVPLVSAWWTHVSAGAQTATVTDLWSKVVSTEGAFSVSLPGGERLHSALLQPERAFVIEGATPVLGALLMRGYARGQEMG